MASQLQDPDHDHEPVHNIHHDSPTRNINPEYQVQNQSSAPQLPQLQPLRTPSIPKVDVDGSQPPPIPHADEYQYQAPTAISHPDAEPAGHLLLLITLAFAAILWLVALISQAFVTANLSNATIRTAWFALFIQLSVILLLSSLLFRSSSRLPYHTQLATVSSLATVFAVIAVDQNIYSRNTAAQRALSAAYLITALIDLFWVFYFTSPPSSPFARVVNGIGGPGTVRLPKVGPIKLRKRHRRDVEGGKPSSNAIDMVPMYEDTTNTRGPQSANGSSRVVSGSGVGDGEGDVSVSALDESRARLSSIAETDTNTRGGQSKRRARGQSGVTTQSGRPDSGATSGRETMTTFMAEALFNYTAQPEDPGELTFKKGDILEILDKSGKWWEARRADGAVGIAPSNYLRPMA